jgi:hypothetical protein
MKKLVICVFLSFRGFSAVSLLEDEENFNSDFMINVIFPKTGTKIAEEYLQKNLKNLILYMDNAPCLNSMQTTMEIQKLGLVRISHLPYSPYFTM